MRQLAKAVVDDKVHRGELRCQGWEFGENEMHKGEMASAGYNINFASAKPTLISDQFCVSQANDKVDANYTQI